jgi:hypothetical protein
VAWRGYVLRVGSVSYQVALVPFRLRASGRNKFCLSVNRDNTEVQGGVTLTARSLKKSAKDLLADPSPSCRSLLLAIRPPLMTTSPKCCH